MSIILSVESCFIFQYGLIYKGLGVWMHKCSTRANQPLFASLALISNTTVKSTKKHMLSSKNPFFERVLGAPKGPKCFGALCFVLKDVFKNFQTKHPCMNFFSRGVSHPVYPLIVVCPT